MKKKILILGITGQDGSYLLDFLIKKNYEVHGLIRKSATGNTKNIDHLIKNHKFFNKTHIGNFNVQKYNPGDHFSHLHSERVSLDSLHRLFAWMTYLNNVDDGGTTNFEYYDIKVKPEIGKTLIWPAEWTHAHTGSILISGTKYIITGWIHFAY